MKHHLENSLWSLLHRFIREHGYVTYGDMCMFTAEEGYKISTAERRLRKSESPEIHRVRAKSKRNTDYICAYEWILNDKIAWKKEEKMYNGIPIFKEKKEVTEKQTKLI